MGVYDPALWDQKTPANVIGGLHRALKAQRDILGRFLPDNPVEALLQVHNLPYNHGVEGGIARVIKAPRDDRGRFKRSKDE